MAASSDETPLASYDDLFLPFHDAEKSRDRFRVGAEMEKPGVYESDFSPVPYEGDRGVKRVLAELQSKFGWHAERETSDGPIIALTKNSASITLEPGAQLELSGAPLETMHEIKTEFDAHLAEIAPISKELGIAWLGIGFHPFATRDELPWVPKLRYGIMRRYLPTRGKFALDMMQRTSTVQANYDYANEEDAMRKLRVSLKLAPLTTALFANSPWYEGKTHGGPSYRAKVWLDVDNDRSGLVPAVWHEGSKYKDYVEWALDVPMFLVKRGNTVHENTGQPFRAFWKEGFQGVRATRGDWQTHINTLFPEVRLKRTLEIRGADAQSRELASALPALWTGILYDDRALADAEALTRDFGFAEVQASRAAIGRLGIGAPFRGAPLRALAERILDIAKGGLVRRARKDVNGRDESVLLAPLQSLVSRGETPGDALLAAAGPDASRAAIVDASRL
ncbi:MAG: glutamate-cysteine ligase family protein [Polyangiaceae bacterium]